MTSRINSATYPVTGRSAHSEPPLPNAVLGMIIFIVAEVMFFAALISAYTIAHSSALGGVWPPPGQPRLPVGRTAINTVVLLISGVLLWISNRCVVVQPRKARCYLGWSILLGIAFVFLQGIEWVALLRQGLTLTSSSLGSFFYLIVGAHALHAAAAIAALVWIYAVMRAGTLKHATFTSVQLFWYFVVCVWPVIYLRVYL